MLYDPKWEVPEVKKTSLARWQEILLKAAAILETDGWTQSNFKDENGYCILGAMHMATYGYVNRLPMTERHDPDMLDGIHKIMANIGTMPFMWNDAHDRTKEQVITKLREVANVV